MDERITLCGREIALRYTINAMCAIEDALGGPLDETAGKEYSLVRALLWGGMVQSRPGITLREVGDMIDAYLSAGGTLETIVESCARALNRAGFIREAA